jgi:hypothetical protein
MDYIHFNPVKHGLALEPSDWPFSSFRQCVAAGLYSEGWLNSSAETSGDRRATIRRPARSVTNRRNSLRHRADEAHRRPRWVPRPKRRVAPALRLLPHGHNRCGSIVGLMSRFRSIAMTVFCDLPSRDEQPCLAIASFVTWGCQPSMPTLKVRRFLRNSTISGRPCADSSVGRLTIAPASARRPLSHFPDWSLWAEERISKS